MTAFLKIQGACLMFAGVILVGLSMFQPTKSNGPLLLTVGAIAWRVADLKRDSAS